MKVFFIGPLPEPITGQSLACQVFLDALQQEHDVKVIDMTKSTFQQGVNSIMRIFEVLKFIASAWRMRRWGDVIYLTVSQSRAGNAKDLLLYIACFAQLKRMVIHVHGGAGLRLLIGRNRRVTRAINRFFLKRLAGVVVLGERHVDMFDGLVKRDKIHIVPNFAQDNLFTTDVAIDEKFANRHPIRLLFLSNLLPGKGHLELVAAFASLDKQTQAEIEINFAGGFEADQQKHEFEKLIEPFPQLHYHGTVRGEKKLELFAASHVFCLPTYYPYEGQPISILEAYATGCAVVTTDHSGIFDTFTDGVNGYAVEKKSVTSLASVLVRISENFDALHSIAKTNLNTAERKYRTEQYNRNLISVLENVENR